MPLAWKDDIAWVSDWAGALLLELEALSISAKETWSVLDGAAERLLGALPLPAISELRVACR
jgi:hypothetical protein